jgi:ketosteroid isomerase-like protein
MSIAKQFPVLAVLVLAACQSPRSADLATVRQEIEASLQRTTQATRSKDIDAYMAEIPAEFVIAEESGSVTTREQQRENILRDWSIIAETLSLTNVVDSIELQGDVALLTTSQRWERLMLQRDGQSTDHVVTTQKHRETWRRTNRGWQAFQIDELGGEILINGQPYKP